MADRLLVEFCSPTFAGIKTGSLFSVSYESREALHGEVRRLNRTLSGKGLRAVPLRLGKRRALIYIYRPGFLRRDLQNACAARLLSERGYTPWNSDLCVAQLIRQMARQKDFPHEIGLFLGYPPEDVEGFIEHRDKGCKCTGFWRVYGDRETAEKQFSRFRKCTDMYRRMIENGKPIEELIVAVG
ncbi:MAG: DUF3793 family protein [Lachnospiraceae bacterium]|nr:DUF3793 family protein [Lachnospiraceae bacterium]